MLMKWSPDSDCKTVARLLSDLVLSFHAVMIDNRCSVVINLESFNNLRHTGPCATVGN